MAFVWELVKNNNSFLRKNLNGIILSAEPGNLYNKHSYKYSGIANEKTVDIQVATGDAAGKKASVVITKSRTKFAKNPTKAKNTVEMKKNVRRQLSAVGKEVGGYRPDLKAAALARLSALDKSLRKQQAEAKSS